MRNDMNSKTKFRLLWTILLLLALGVAVTDALARQTKVHGEVGSRPAFRVGP